MRRWSALDSLDIALDVLFFTMFGVALLRFVGQPDPLHRDVLLVFASFAGLFLIALVLRVWPVAPAALTVAWILLLFLQPPLTLRVAGHFRKPPRWLLPLASAWMALSLVFVLTTNVSRGVGLPVAVGYLVVIDLVGAREFRLAASARVGTARVRLASSAVATALFALALLLVGLAAGGRALGIALDGADQLARLMGVLAALGYLAAFLPPERLLLGVQRAIAFGWLDTISRGGGGSVPDTWAALAEAARSISGARSVLVLAGDAIAASAGEPVNAIPPEAIDVPERPTRPSIPLLNSRAWLRSTGGAVDGPCFRTVRLSDEAGPGTRLVLRFEGTPLFVEDDVALITLLGDEAARAIVRDRALGERAALERQLIVERHRADDEARLGSLLDAQPTALIAVGPTRRILYANERAAALFSLDHAAIMHASVDTLLPGALDPSDLHGGVAVAQGPQEPAVREPREGIALKPDGRSIPVEVGLSEWSGASDTMTLVTVTDITGRKTAETMRERFIDLLSHELRTPVTAIYGGAQLLATRHGKLAEETEREVLVGIAAEADRLQRMVENLIALARVERGVPMVADDPVLLQRLVPRLVAQEQGQWPGARLEHRLPPGLATVRGDDDYLGQVLRNLLSNAIKYGDDVGPIEVTAVEDARTVTLLVADRGLGFPQEEAESLFGLYYRSESAPRHIQGAGIGLFVCRRIVEAMGGRIRASARPGGGSVFEVELLIYDSDEVLRELPGPGSAGVHGPGVPAPVVVAA